MYSRSRRGFGTENEKHEVILTSYIEHTKQVYEGGYRSNKKEKNYSNSDLEKGMNKNKFGYL
jgi:hypothetical protein